MIVVTLRCLYIYIYTYITDGTFTLSCWRDVCFPVTLRAKPTVGVIPAGSPKPDRSRGLEPDEERYLEGGNFDKIPPMPEAASSLTTRNAEQMMIEMVQDCTASGVTRRV